MREKENLFGGEEAGHEKLPFGIEVKKVNNILKRVDGFCQDQSKKIMGVVSIIEKSGDKDSTQGLRITAKKLGMVLNSPRYLQLKEKVNLQYSAASPEDLSIKQGLRKILGAVADVGCDLNESLNKNTPENLKSTIQALLVDFESSLKGNLGISRIDIDKGYKINYNQNPDIISVVESDNSSDDETVADVLREGYRFKDELLGEYVVRPPWIEAYKHKS